ncbi:pectin lyase-like protein, partial [Aureobasidium melanogenum]
MKPALLYTRLLGLFLGANVVWSQQIDTNPGSHIANDKLKHVVAKQAPAHLVAAGFPDTLPLPPPAYMRDNTGNYFGSFWLGNFEYTYEVGKMPYAPKDYIFYRNVKDYGAVGDGVTDDTDAINTAASSGYRCGEDCGSSSTLGALVYFPPGTYKISAPIVQYYYTQFVGNPNDRPVIKGSSDFSGIALFDSDVYIPEGSGAEWYINQNQFYRQVRNFVFDLTDMSSTNEDNGQVYVPTGIHWQVAQATSLQNCHFEMPQGGGTQAVGVFMENGSGGFVSDLSFFGGNIGLHAGSQQFTARGLSFRSVGKAVVMIWDWGFTFKNMDVFSCYVAISCSDFGGDSGQGTGSISVIDSNFDSVSYAITVKNEGPYPNIVLDNVRVSATSRVVIYDGTGNYLLSVSGTQVIDSWATGRRYTTLDGKGTSTTGFVTPKPSKPASLLDANGTYYARSKPQYEFISGVVNVVYHGISNEGTGDNTGAINTILRESVGSMVFFPAGVYRVEGTVEVPVGSVIVGAGWSQIMAAGSYFEDETNPQVMVRVGQSGDVGSVELSDLLFTVSGPTAGAILVEWNVHQGEQGSAAMWDCHFRVGGAKGSNLQLEDCPASSTIDKNCMAASMLMHVTKDSSGYFENIWAWTADHDLDAGGCDGKSTTCSQLNIYSARGILIESQGPTWFYGTASEHNVLYQYQLSGAKDIYLGHMQTETPYYQPTPDASSPFTIGTFRDDPSFEDCNDKAGCAEAWALRILNSRNTFIYSAGFYSFFSSYDQACIHGGSEDCQNALLQTSYSQGIYVYNLFTKGGIEAASPLGGIQALSQKENQDQFTTEVSVWIPLAEAGGNLGGSTSGNTGSDHSTPKQVGIVSLRCTTLAPSATFTLSPACTGDILALPTSGSAAAKNNNPPGPDSCNERCDFWRLITGTCCGYGGSISNPIEIPSGVVVPYDIPIPTGYVPSFNLSIPRPGTYDPDELFGGDFVFPPGELFATSTLAVTTTTTNGVLITTTVMSRVPKSSHTTTYVLTDDNGHRTTATRVTPDDPTKTRHPHTKGIRPDGSGCTVGDCGCYPSGTVFDNLVAGIASTGSHVLPGGFCDPDHSLVFPPASLPIDPPCYGSYCRPCTAGVCGDTGTSEGGASEPGTTECSASAQISDDMGFCSNGNYPIWNPETGAIDCDTPLSGAADNISDCQEQAESDTEDVLNDIECVDQCSGTGAGLTARASNCKAPDTYEDDKTGDCDGVFLCDTDKWPNVCNNVRSAFDKKPGASSPLSILTYQGEGKHDTSRWLKLHSWEKPEDIGQDRRLGNYASEGTLRPNAKKGVNFYRDTGVFPELKGWGLVGCQVEEYPFGNSVSEERAIAKYDDRPTLRLIPQAENGKHGSALRQFITYMKKKTNKDKGFKYCVKVTGSNQPSDYCINDNADCNNKCAAAYGPAYILVNEALDKDRKAAAVGEQRWDKWFDEKPGRKFVHTLSWDPDQLPNKVPITTVLPPQFGPTPAPGLKIYVGDFPNGQWENEYTVTSNNPSKGQKRVVGVSVARDPVNAEGTNLFYDDPPAPHFPAKKRDEGDSALLGLKVSQNAPDELLALSERGEWNKINSTAAAIDEGSHSAGQLARRQNVGSFLDARVYTNALACPLESDPTNCDVCDDWEDSYSQYGPGDGTIATYTVTGVITGPGATGVPGTDVPYEPPGWSGDAPPPEPTANTARPQFKYNGKYYPGGFEFYYYHAFQYGPQNTVIAEQQGILGFDRPAEIPWSACADREVYRTSAT